MDKNPNIIGEEKLIKNFFAVKDILYKMRSAISQSPSVLGNLSITEVYDFLNEVIDLVVFIRREQDNIFPRRNPEIRADPKGPTFSNVGGLIRIKLPEVRIPVEEKELKALFSIKYALVSIKRELELGVHPNLSVSVDIDPEKIKRNNKRYYHFRKNRR